MSLKKGLVVATAVAVAIGFSGCTQQVAASSGVSGGTTKVVKAATPSELGLYPPNAKPGECYAKVLIPAKYKTVTEKVLVQEPGYKLICKPPVYKTVTERVLVRQPGYKLICKPPVYKTVTEKVLVQPATTEWRKGTGVVTPVNGKVTDVNCLVRVPPKYKTIKKKVLVKPATTVKVPIPPKYKTVKKEVLAKPAESVKVPIPPKYKTITKRIKVSNAYYTWQKVECRGVTH
ncbi:MAG: hypothetical protein GXN91_03500 [Epsilonproteobacteria bacterium]|nr:hypothetical protein [Campylobacterota bacterium]